MPTPCCIPTIRIRQQGWIGTANQRTFPHGYGMQLSNSWDYPERAERIAELAGAGKHDTRSMIAMQYDQTTTVRRQTEENVRRARACLSR